MISGLAAQEGYQDRHKTGQAEIFRGLVRRNRLVFILRLAVPGIGVLFTVFLVFQIIVSSIATDYGISSLRVERDQVVIEQPRYGGVMKDGTTYRIVSDVARVRISSRDIVDLAGASIQIEQPDGYGVVADADWAQLNLASQNVAVPGLLKTLDSDNVRGFLNDVLIDWPARELRARGPVRLEFEDGSLIRAQSLVYDAKSGEWDFSGVTYNAPGDGGL